MRSKRNNINYYLGKWLLQVSLLVLLVFSIQQLVPSDAAEILLEQQGVDKTNSDRYEKLYAQAVKNMGLNKPIFYFGISSRLTSSIHVPVINWNGTDNQFHRWISNILSGEAGVSLINGKSVATLVGAALMWTVPISCTALLLVYFISKWLGRYLKIKRSKWVEGLLFFFYSIPLIWLGLLVMLFFTNDYFGIELFDIGPQYGSATIWQKVNRAMPVVLCMIVSDIAYLTSVYGTSIEIENQKPYFITALSKGLRYHDAIIHHSSPNALLSMMTIFVGAIPMSIAGSVILETIFNIPGIGRLLYTSIKHGDYPVILFVVLIIGLVTSFVYAIGDYYISNIKPSASLEK